MSHREPITGLDDSEQKWYDGLDEDDLAQMRNAYIDRVVSKDKMSKVSYEGFVKVCARVAVKLHSKQTRKEHAALRRLEAMGKK
jgi:hypothetical protein